MQHSTYKVRFTSWKGDSETLSILLEYFVGDDDNEKDIRCVIYPVVKPELASKQKSWWMNTTPVDSVSKQKDFLVVINTDTKIFVQHRSPINALRTRDVAVLTVD